MARRTNINRSEGVSQGPSVGTTERRAPTASIPNTAAPVTRTASLARQMLSPMEQLDTNFGKFFGSAANTLMAVNEQDRKKRVEEAIRQGEQDGRNGIVNPDHVSSDAYIESFDTQIGIKLGQEVATDFTKALSKQPPGTDPHSFYQTFRKEAFKDPLESSVAQQAAERMFLKQADPTIRQFEQANTLRETTDKIGRVTNNAVQTFKRDPATYNVESFNQGATALTNTTGFYAKVLNTSSTTPTAGSGKLSLFRTLVATAESKDEINALKRIMASAGSGSDENSSFLTSFSQEAEKLNDKLTNNLLLANTEEERRISANISESISSIRSMEDAMFVAQSIADFEDMYAVEVTALGLKQNLNNQIKGLTGKQSDLNTFRIALENGKTIHDAKSDKERTAINRGFVEALRTPMVLPGVPGDEADDPTVETQVASLSDPMTQGKVVDLITQMDTYPPALQAETEAAITRFDDPNKVNATYQGIRALIDKAGPQAAYRHFSSRTMEIYEVIHTEVSTSDSPLNEVIKLTESFVASRGDKSFNIKAKDIIPPTPIKSADEQLNARIDRAFGDMEVSNEVREAMRTATLRSIYMQSNPDKWRDVVDARVKGALLGNDISIQVRDGKPFATLASDGMGLNRLGEAVVFNGQTVNTMEEFNLALDELAEVFPGLDVDDITTNWRGTYHELNVSGQAVAIRPDAEIRIPKRSGSMVALGGVNEAAFEMVKLTGNPGVDAEMIKKTLSPRARALFKIRHHGAPSPAYEFILDFRNADYLKEQVDFDALDKRHAEAIERQRRINKVSEEVKQLQASGADSP